MARIVAINGSPRTHWNTATLVGEAARGAQEAGAEVERFDLYRLPKFTGCVSCFGCKRDHHRGVCIGQDGLTPVLDAIREADGLILGSPNYLGNITAATRSLYERLIFQHITYDAERYVENDRPIPVLFIMTSNVPVEAYASCGYEAMVEGYRSMLSTAVGPTEVLLSGDTLQVKDYSKYSWTAFDAEEKQRRHKEVFPKEMQRSYELGRALVR